MNENQKRLVEHWLNLERTGQLPTWSIETILDHHDLAANLMVFDHSREGQFVVRYHGTSSIERIGSDFTGQDYLQSSASLDADALFERSRIVLTTPCGSLVDYQILNRKRLYLYTICSLALPYADSNGEPHILLNYIDPTTEPLTVSPEFEKAWIGDGVTTNQHVDLGYGLPPQADASTGA